MYLARWNEWPCLRSLSVVSVARGQVVTCIKTTLRDATITRPSLAEKLPNTFPSVSDVPYRLWGFGVIFHVLQDRRVAAVVKKCGHGRQSEERGAVRGMPAATYVSVLVRAHLRHLAPLPKDELMALKASIAQLGVIGRNLNQIAYAVRQGDSASGPRPDDVEAMLKICTGLRDHFKATLLKNLRSWQDGYDSLGP